MQSRTIKTFFILLLFSSFPVWSQDAQEAPEGAEEVLEEEIIVVEEKLEPILPRRDSSLIFVEGEDAVSTNFNREPILNYSCSGFRTLQLNQLNDLHGEANYNSDYVFYVEQDGVYELWYGGTPPGNRDDVITSYASPFRYVLDGIYTEDVYREDVNVVEEYSPSYYWNYVSDLTLAAGEHRIKFEVLFRRSLDNRYYFYLDNFFLVRKENGQRVSLGALPEIFPKDMEDRSIDTPFKPFEEYEVLIRDNPEVVDNYIELAKMYSLAGDYLNALKYLRRAAFLSPDEPEIMLLLAKNLIWKGSVVEGLDMYRELLEIIPERTDLWTEAGKIAAWTGLYFDSLEFFDGGLDILPDDLSLLTNLGITNLWMGDVNQAELIFEKVAKQAGEELDSNIELAEIFRINGYPDRAIAIYRSLINLYPAELQLYFDLEQAYIENDEREKIPSIRDITANTFITGTDYTIVTNSFYEAQNMKEEVIGDYEEQLLADPENLNLRRVLAEIYFWNGYRKRAIAEYRNILTSYTYTNILQTEQKMMPFLELIDRNYALSHYLDTIPGYITENQKEMAELLKVYQKAKADHQSMKKRNDDTEAKGETPDRTAEQAKQEEIYSLEEELAVLIYLGESFLEKFQSLASQFEEETASLADLMVDEEASAEAFELLMEGVDWKWNRDYMVSELEAVKKDGVVLGNYALGKILMFEGNPSSARGNFEPLIEGETILKPGPFALYQSQVWLGEEEKRLELYENFSAEIDETCDYIYYLNDYLDIIHLVDEDVFTYLTGDPDDSIDNLIDSYKDVVKRASDMSRTVSDNISEIHKVLKTNMERGFYNLASETYLLRNELGDFYYNQQQYGNAIDQYEQVLAIDPWNLSAKFRLAQVYHLSGDWARAIKIYGEIYEEDAQFNNVASFYNELSRQFADSFNFYAKSFSDTSTLNFIMNADYNVKFSPLFGMKLEYGVEYDRIYRTYTEETGTNTSTIVLSGLGLSFPLKLSRFNVTPMAGLYAKTDLVDGTGLSDTDEPLLPDNPSFGLLSEWDFYPRFGADLSLSFDSLWLQGGYRFDWLADSFHGGSDILYHQAKADMSINFLKTKVPVLEDTTIFASGKGQFLNDGNLLWSASALLANKIQLKREPAMYLNVGLDFSLEDAIDESSGYWAPQMSLLTGLNLEYEAEFTLGENLVLGERLWFNTDYTSSGEDEAKATGLAFEVGNSLFYTKSDFTAWFNVSGNFTKQLDPSLDGLSYWSLNFEVGVSALFPELLVP